MASYKTYWSTWLVLLILTVGMIVVGTSAMSKGGIALLLLAAMSAKAALIGGNFMHLRYERLSLIWIVILGILLTALVLFFGIAPDGIRILSLSRH